jgi:hypothetical protein
MLENNETELPITGMQGNIGPEIAPEGSQSQGAQNGICASGH